MRKPNPLILDRFSEHGTGLATWNDQRSLCVLGKMRQSCENYRGKNSRYKKLGMERPDRARHLCTDGSLTGIRSSGKKKQTDRTWNTLPAGSWAGEQKSILNKAYDKDKRDSVEVKLDKATIDSESFWVVAVVTETMPDSERPRWRSMGVESEKQCAPTFIQTSPRNFHHFLGRATVVDKRYHPLRDAPLENCFKTVHLQSCETQRMENQRGKRRMGRYKIM